MLSVTEHSTVCDVALTVQATKDCMLFGLVSSLYTYTPNKASKKAQKSPSFFLTGCHQLHGIRRFTSSVCLYIILRTCAK